MFPFQEECFNPPFPLFVTRRVMTPSTLFPRHTFQYRLCQPPPPRPNCAFVYLKIHHQSAICLNGPPTLHRMTGPLILNPILRTQKFHSSGVPHHRVYTKETKQTKKEKSSVQGCSGIGTKKQKIKIDFFLMYIYFM